MQIRWYWVVAAAAACVLCGAEEAWAWGPATHARLALDLLGQPSLLPAGIAALLARRTASFVFGNIAADVVFAKRLSRVRQFCHHWSTGFHLLDGSRTEADQAFAYGYLAHIAADTVAHNKYVPHQLSVTRTTLNFGHLYWEMRADALVDDESWRTMEEVLAVDHEHHHRVLAGELTATLLPYGFNRRLFEGINRTVSRDYWKNCTSMWYRMSRWRLPAGLVDAYRHESVARITSVLAEGRSSPFMREDPNGNGALREARWLRREYRRLQRRGLPTEQRSCEAAAGLLPVCAPADSYAVPRRNW